MIRVLLIDDHEMVRMGLAAFLEQDRRILKSSVKRQMDKKV